MSKLKIFLVLVACSVAFAVPFKVETVKDGSGEVVRAGQLIKVHYKGYLAVDSAAVNKAATDSTVEAPYFANSYYSEQPLEFTLGVGQVIEGWDKGLVGMKIGEIRKLSVPSVMAYGDNSLEGIPPNSDLMFVVELVHAEKPLDADKFPADVDKFK